MQFLDNNIPAHGYWLRSIPFRGSNTMFDITDVATYPFSDFSVSEVNYHIKQLLTKYIYYTGNKRIYNVGRQIKVVDTSNKDCRRHFLLLLNYVRTRFAKAHNYADEMLDLKILHPSLNLSKSEMKKREFFLHVAKLVVSGVYSESSAARKFGLDKVNVSIWVQNFLTYGEDVFFAEIPRVSLNDQYRCAYMHLTHHRRVSDSCTRLRIFSHNRFKHILRRYRKACLPSIHPVDPSRLPKRLSP